MKLVIWLVLTVLLNQQTVFQRERPSDNSTAMQNTAHQCMNNAITRTNAPILSIPTDVISPLMPTDVTSPSMLAEVAYLPMPQMSHSRDADGCHIPVDAGRGHMPANAPEVLYQGCRGM